LNSNRLFFALITLVQAVVIVIVLFVDHLLVMQFGLDKSNFFLISTFLIVLGVSLFWFFSYSIFETFFATKKRLQSMVQKTLHELNTPVATIKINTKMLRKKLEKSDLQKLRRIDDACEGLLQLYEDMEYGIKKEVHYVGQTSFNLSQAVEKSIRKFDDIRQSIRIESFVPDEATIKTDEKGFIRVVDNLVSNAIKYNKPEGFVKIYFKNKTLIVEDSGIGIDTKNLFVVFDSYYQANPQNEGFGMGLAIVKEFCDKHKIAINIDSKEGEGTTIFLDLKYLSD